MMELWAQHALTLNNLCFLLITLTFKLLEKISVEFPLVDNFENLEFMSSAETI